MAKNSDEKKDGVSIQQIENFGKRYRIEIFFSILLIVASCFSAPFYGMGWSVYAAGLGGAVAVWIPKQIGRMTLAIAHFCLKQQRVTRIVIACIAFVFAIFIPPLVFLFLGLVGGRNLHRLVIECAKTCGSCKDEEHHN